MAANHIQLRGVRVHNLRGVDLDLPHQQLIAFCGVSGSGKTSLALDTLYAEGQRRYIESFSAYTRQFLERLDKPDAEHIEGIPPAIAVTHKDYSRSTRTTVGGATEVDDYLRLMFAKIGRLFCHSCSREIRRDSPASVTERLRGQKEGSRFQIAFARSAKDSDELRLIIDELKQDGFVRAVVGETTYSLADLAAGFEAVEWPVSIWTIVDRLVVSDAMVDRVADSLETAFNKGVGCCHLLTEDPLNGQEVPLVVDGRTWCVSTFSSSLTCVSCDIEYPAPDPRLFNYNSPLGACPTCEGLGTVVDLDMELIVPDPNKSLRNGAIAPWRTQPHSAELQSLLEAAADFELPVDIPYRTLSDSQRQLVYDGIPTKGFAGLSGFFAQLEKSRQKVNVRVFLNRWRTQRPCPTCDGARLTPAALATKIAGRSIAELTREKTVDLLEFLSAIELTDWQRSVGQTMLDQVRTRLRFLETVGLGYVTLDRALRSLSSGEAQRVGLTSALGSSLVNMLYVLDEPSVGLHPRDVDRLVTSIEALRDRGNTVVVVEHEEGLLRAADHVVEVGSTLR